MSITIIGLCGDHTETVLASVILKGSHYKMINLFDFVKIIIFSEGKQPNIGGILTQKKSLICRGRQNRQQQMTCVQKNIVSCVGTFE